MVDSGFLTQEEINALLEASDDADDDEEIAPPSPPARKSEKEKNVATGAVSAIKNNEPESSRDVSANLSLIMNFPLILSVRLGQSVKSLGDVRLIGPGVVLELDRFINEPLDILINNKLIAQGEVVVIDESFGIKITHIITPVERIRKLG